MSWLIANRLHFHATTINSIPMIFSLVMFPWYESYHVKSLMFKVKWTILCFLLWSLCTPHTLQFFHVSQRASSFQFIEFCPRNDKDTISSKFILLRIICFRNRSNILASIQKSNDQFRTVILCNDHTFSFKDQRIKTEKLVTWTFCDSSGRLTFVKQQPWHIFEKDSTSKSLVINFQCFN